MTPDDLARRHPYLYHATTPGAAQSIEKHDLLPTSSLLDLFEVHGAARCRIERHPSRTGVALHHPLHGTAVISDNSPLSVGALEVRLDDGPHAADWLRMLNERVFFWADEQGLARLLRSRLNRRRVRDVLVVDALSLARAHGTAMEMPINTGAAIRGPARRGLATFSPLCAYSYEEWQTLRGRRDRILEVTIREPVPDIQALLIRIIRCEAGSL
jgi:hypothetical protein